MAASVVVEGLLKADGSLELDERLTLPPGRVRVTLEPVPEKEDGLEAGEPPEWLNVETEIYVPMQGKVQTIGDVTIVDRGRASPTVILPEDFLDD